MKPNHESYSYLGATKKIQSEHEEVIRALIKKRESSMSTGVGFGFGIPHASTDLVSQVVWVLGRSAKGIRFDAMDGRPVNLVMLFLMPQGEFEQHLHTISHLAKLLHRAEFRDELTRRFL